MRQCKLGNFSCRGGGKIKKKGKKEEEKEEKKRENKNLKEKKKKRGVLEKESPEEGGTWNGKLWKVSKIAEINSG